MSDWRIKYYSDLIITEYNRRIVMNNKDEMFVDSKFANDLCKKEKQKDNTLDTLSALKKVLQDIKEGKYDKYRRKTSKEDTRNN